jgi:hypothetical protein
MPARSIAAAVILVGVSCALGCRGDRTHVDDTVATAPPALGIAGAGVVREWGSAWFDGRTVRLVAARGEVLGVQVAATGAIALAVPDAVVAGYDVRAVHVAHPSTDLYGASTGAGDYYDELVAAPHPAGPRAYFTVAVARDAAPGARRGTLVAGDQRVAVELVVSPVVMPALPVESVWAYYDPRELGGKLDAPSPAERACIAMFRDRGVLLSPDLPVDAWPARRDLLAGVPDLPAVVPDDPSTVGDAVEAWIAATRGTGQLPFAIPIDEPHGPARDDVARLAAAVRAAGGGPTTFRYAVTADPDATLGDVDLYITLHARRDDRAVRWTYNGAPPRAGAMVVDTPAPGLRTWGWIAARYAIPTWYVWDALYWHDRHAAKQRHDAGLGHALDRADPVTFDDGEDHGNLDGVLAYPGDDTAPCRPSLRLEALRRGLEDRALLDAAMACRPDAAAAELARIVPVALGDAPPSGPPAWPADDAAFEAARRHVLELAAGCGSGHGVPGGSADGYARPR